MAGERPVRLPGAQHRQSPVAPVAPVSPVSGQQGLRAAMARFATGVTVLTAAGERAHGMTANALTSVSLDPPLVLCCVARAARLHAAITAVGAFGVSVLGTGQAELARYFADWRRPGGMAQFDTVAWTPGAHTGAPLLDGALAWLECELAATHEGGDHSIFVGSVLSASRGAPADALIYYGGQYHVGGGQRRASA